MQVRRYNHVRANVRNFLVGLTLAEVRKYRAEMVCDGSQGYVDEFIYELESELDGPVSGNDYPLPFTD